jgi:hypothetical protein
MGMGIDMRIMSGRLFYIRTLDIGLDHLSIAATAVCDSEWRGLQITLS